MCEDSELIDDRLRLALADLLEVPPVIRDLALLFAWAQQRMHSNQRNAIRPTLQSKLIYQGQELVDESDSLFEVLANLRLTLCSLLLKRKVRRQLLECQSNTHGTNKQQ